MSTNLLVHNILFMGGGILNIILAFTVLYIRRKKMDNLVVTFALMTLSVSIFQITQVLGVNAADAVSSRKIFMWNLCVIPIQIFMTHWFFALLGTTRTNRKALGLVYGSGIALMLLHIILPETYLLDSVPKMYFPFYYEPGSLQGLTRAWFHIVGAYYFIVLLKAYRNVADPVMKNRYLFVLLAVLYGFIVGESAVFLVYDIPFDPMWSSFFGLYTFLIAYSILRYQLLNVRIIVQRTFLYAMLISVLIGFIIIANTSTEYVRNTIPDFPIWVMPAVSAFVALSIGLSLWKKLRENDEMKYEFITVIAHKFRTPLTQTKWSTEELMEKETDPEKIKTLQYIKESNDKLVNLTGTLVEMSDEASTVDVLYKFKSVSLIDLVRSVTGQMSEAFTKKNITFKLELPINDLFVLADVDRLSFVLQTLLENSITYTPARGSIVLTLSRSQGKAHISVADNGIGIAKNEIPRIFSKFYRTHLAQNTDTEGFGVGLYLAKSVTVRHSGTIDVYSDGEGKGSTFTIILPALK